MATRSSDVAELLASQKRPAENTQRVEDWESGEDTLMIQGYRKNLAKFILFIFLSILSFGILPLIFYLYPTLRIKFTHTLCDLIQADKVIIEDNYGQRFWSQVEHSVPHPAKDQVPVPFKRAASPSPSASQSGDRRSQIISSNRPPSWNPLGAAGSRPSSPAVSSRSGSPSPIVGQNQLNLSLSLKTAQGSTGQATGTDSDYTSRHPTPEHSPAGAPSNEKNDQNQSQIEMEPEGDRVRFRLQPKIASSTGQSPTGDDSDSPYENGYMEACTRYFIHHKTKYVWEDELMQFVKLQPIILREPTLCSYMYDRINVCEMQGELDASTRKRALTFFGENVLRISVPPFLRLFFTEIFSLYYLIPTMGILVMYFFDYYLFATIVLCISTISVILSVYFTRNSVREMKFALEVPVNVSLLRGKKEGPREMPGIELVPGDLIELPLKPTKSSQEAQKSSISSFLSCCLGKANGSDSDKANAGWPIPCDLVILSGDCVVNESSLTGESTPITKTPLPNSEEVLFSPTGHSRHILYAGTRLLQVKSLTSEPARAFVLRTGFLTAKGEFLKAILYPRPFDFVFIRQSYYFIGLLALVGTIFMIIGYIFLFTMDLPDLPLYVKILVPASGLTLIVPPTLPMAMVNTITWANKRLRSTHHVYCTNPSYIVVTGGVNCVCFDKTGTLTEASVDVKGIMPINGIMFGELIEPDNFLKIDYSLSRCLATCHTLTKIDGKLEGDPLDLKMFESSKWMHQEMANPFGGVSTSFFIPPPTTGSAEAQKFALSPLEYLSSSGVEVVRSFPFASALHRMSILLRTTKNTTLHAYLKGSPEVVASLCAPESIPQNFAQVLKSHSAHGFRVLALAEKKVTLPSGVRVEDLRRDQIESEMTMLALLILENKIKPESVPVIHELKSASIHTLMVTGDNLLTSLNVGLQCGFIEPGKKLILLETDTLLSVARSSLIPGPQGLATAGLDRYSKSRLAYKLLMFTENGPEAKTCARKSTPKQADKGKRVAKSESKRPIIKNKDRMGKHEVGDEEESEQVELNTFRTGQKTSATVSPLPVIRKPDPNVPITLDMSDGIEQDIVANEENYRIVMNGTAWEIVRRNRDILPLVLRRGAIYSRMLPEQKRQLIEELQGIGYIVSMVGDGTNDCGAMRAAHAGIAIGAGEASVAAPFSTNSPNISCVPNVLREGRAALATAFGLFKYMSFHACTQYFAMNTLYINMSFFGTAQFLYQDLFHWTPLSTFWGMTCPSGALTSRLPPVSLLHWRPILSIFINVVLVLFFQIGALNFLVSQPWYTSSEFLAFAPAFYKLNQTYGKWFPTDMKNPNCYENTVIFFISTFLIAFYSIIFTISFPFRKPIWTNWLMVVFLFLTFVLTICYFFLYSPRWFQWLLYLLDLPSYDFKLIIVLALLAFFIIMYLTETYVTNSEWLDRLVNCIVCRCRKRPTTDENELVSALKQMKRRDSRNIVQGALGAKGARPSQSSFATSPSASSLAPFKAGSDADEVPPSSSVSAPAHDSKRPQGAPRAAQGLPFVDDSAVRDSFDVDFY